MASVEIVLPVYNEERVLADSVVSCTRTWAPMCLMTGPNHNRRQRLEVTARRNCRKAGTSSCRVSEVFHVPEAGRGRALTQAWLGSDADVSAYMDIDLSTGLESLPPLIDAIATGRADVASGTRLGPGAQTNRSFKREVLSRGYVFMINTAFRGVRLRDMQCGFKAISRECAQTVLPLVQRHRLVLGHGATSAGGQRRLEGALHPCALGRGHGQPGENRQHGSQRHPRPLAHAVVRLASRREARRRARSGREQGRLRPRAPWWPAARPRPTSAACQTRSGWIFGPKTLCAKPQSEPAMTFSRPRVWPGARCAA